MEKWIVRNMIPMPNKRKWPIIAKYILIICGTILILGTVLQVILGEDISIFMEIIFPLIIIIQGLRLNERTKVVVPVLLEIYLKEGEIRFVYPEIDKQDGKGVRRETYVYRQQDIKDLAYNNEEKVLGIIGMPGYIAEYPDGRVEHIHGRQQQMEYDFYVTLQEDETRKQLLEKIKINQIIKNQGGTKE